jgi:mono/diheme cytochrome c family protein
MPFFSTMKTPSLLSLCVLLLSACDNTQHTTPEDTLIRFNQLTFTPKADTQRWYVDEQAERGKTVFASHCVVCHGKNAEATQHWKTLDAHGNYPPPPLNGSAHAWHHPLAILRRTIYHGGAPVGGQMPAFKAVLSETDIVDVIAYFQSHWSDDIYQRWLKIETSFRQQSQK